MHLRGENDGDARLERDLRALARLVDRRGEWESLLASILPRLSDVQTELVVLDAPGPLLSRREFDAHLATEADPEARGRSAHWVSAPARGGAARVLRNEPLPDWLASEPNL